MKIKAQQVIAEILSCQVEELDDNSALGLTPQWDSLSHVSIMLFLEERFGIEINEQSLEKYRTMTAIKELFKDE